MHCSLTDLRVRRRHPSPIVVVVLGGPSRHSAAHGVQNLPPLVAAQREPQVVLRVHSVENIQGASSEAIPLVRCSAFLLRFFSIKNSARSWSLEEQGSSCSFWPKLSNDLNLSKIRPCLAEKGPTLFQPNQQERTAPNQRNRLCCQFQVHLLMLAKYALIRTVLEMDVQPSALGQSSRFCVYFFSTECWSQGRAKLRAFPRHLARENTQLSPS